MTSPPGARYIQLLGQDGQPSALLVAYGRKWSANILERWRQRPQESPKGTISAEIVDLFSRCIPAISASLSKGNLFQVIGTPDLLRGINAGTHALMQTSTGTLGTVVSTSSGQIAGQLRFEPSTSLAPAVGPTLAWSLLNAVAGTVQLQRINMRLDVLIRQIEKLSFRQEAEVVGRLVTSINVLDDLLHEYQHTGNLNKLATSRLAEAEKDVGSIYERNKILIDEFSSRVEATLDATGRLGAEKAATLIREDGHTAVQDMQVFATLIAARNRVTQLQIYHDLIEQPSYAGKRMETAANRMNQHKIVMESCNTVESLRSHAKQCIGQMNWFQRNIFDRSTVKMVDEALSYATPCAASGAVVDVTPGFCFWQGNDGSTQARLVMQD
ncbi:hypothetical protein KBZ15_08645 [Cyanobium sp. BA20m-p-22]|uniref:hypothetical protein n=1 Tax=Cyanobium sp. BA20m-p-22 TaxID=2823704 RepID=UPI0020CE5E37|nr:hypothetical protein [Cyanobium sp. BA20m-p-22]MCP9909970.1 hypothetical protein [Cyanobium sp. BA20m-p-22]